MVRGTADPSAALGMTKGRGALPWRAFAGLKEFFITLGEPRAHESSVQQQLFVESAPLPFVIPSAAEGSAVLPTSAAIYNESS